MIRSAAFALTAVFALSPTIPSAHAQNAPALRYAAAPGATDVTQQPPVAGGSPTGWWTDGSRGGIGGMSAHPYRPGFTPVPAPPPMPVAE